MRSIELEEVLQNFHSALGRDAFRVKLYAPDWERFMAQAHNFAFLGFRGHFERVRERGAFNEQGVIAGGGKVLRHVFEDVAIFVMDGRCLAVHQAIGANDTPAEIMADRLMSEAHA